MTEVERRIAQVDGYFESMVNRVSVGAVPLEPRLDNCAHCWERMTCAHRRTHSHRPKPRIVVQCVTSGRCILANPIAPSVRNEGRLATNRASAAPNQRPIQQRATDPVRSGVVIASSVVSWSAQLVPVLGVVCLASCVPRDPPDASHKQPVAVASARFALPRWRPRPVIHARDDARDARKHDGSIDASASSNDALLRSQFRDSFERDELGADWGSTSNNWRIDDGRLCGRSSQNHPIWLKRRIPRNARVGFVAQTKSSEGDIKAEIWGNGASFAKGTTYDDATSYVLIFGGWKNHLHVLARLNEHDEKRQELRLRPDSDDPRLQPVIPEVEYRFVIERTDGKTVVWRVNDIELFRFEDPDPLHGPQHDHFGFNNWETPICFDDLTITPLPELTSGRH